LYRSRYFTRLGRARRNDPADFLMTARFRGGASCPINSPHASVQVGASETLAGLVQALVLRDPVRSAVTYLQIDTKPVLHLGWLTLTVRGPQPDSLNVEELGAGSR